ncbi:MAG TPA: AAA family ATPase [Candidatus Limnocylindrales bacterium]|nr:AAA family ATPase [Candidatus Limnocylindrales bacterium]
MSRIELRDPTLVVLVGAAGSGKSTFAGRWFEPSEVLSSDAFREILTGDAGDQRATKTAFSIIHREVTKRLAADRTVVVDATNVEAAARRQLIARARFRGAPAVAIVFALPRDVVMARNAARPGRVVDPAVVARHLDRLDAALATLADEGFTAVTVVRTPAEADAIVIERS